MPRLFCLYLGAWVATWVAAAAFWGAAAAAPAHGGGAFFGALLGALSAPVPVFAGWLCLTVWTVAVEIVRPLAELLTERRAGRP